MKDQLRTRIIGVTEFGFCCTIDFRTLSFCARQSSLTIEGLQTLRFYQTLFNILHVQINTFFFSSFFLICHFGGLM